MIKKDSLISLIFNPDLQLRLKRKEDWIKNRHKEINSYSKEVQEEILNSYLIKAKEIIDIIVMFFEDYSGRGFISFFEGGQIVINEVNSSLKDFKYLADKNTEALLPFTFLDSNENIEFVTNIIQYTYYGCTTIFYPDLWKGSTAGEALGYHFFKKDEIQSIKSLFVTNFKLFSDLLDEVLNKERRLLELDDELIQQLIKKCIIDNDSAPYLCNSLRKLIDDVKDYYKSKSMEPPGRNFYLKFFWKKSNGKPYSPSSFNNYTLY